MILLDIMTEHTTMILFNVNYLSNYKQNFFWSRSRMPIRLLEYMLNGSLVKGREKNTAFFIIRINSSINQ